MSTTKNFTVTGMTCSSCEGAVSDELEELTGIASFTVSAAQGELNVTLAEGAAVTDAEIIAAVSEAGYQAVAV